MDEGRIAFRKTGLFSKLIVDYVEEDPNLSSFYENAPTLEGFKKAINARKFNSNYRDTLVEVLKKQYTTINTSQKVEKNIKSLLDSKTFTVTTGHQLNIFTGPLFYIYKLVSTINLAKKLAKTYPAYRFVPIYWMGTEDHDFEEINHVYINAKKYEWKTQQSGATGRFNTDSLTQVLDKIPGRVDVFKKALQRQKNLSDVVCDYINTLFGDEGLVCLNPDNPLLKKEFYSVLKEDIFKKTPYTLVNKQSDLLKKAGYKKQVNPRHLNLFYLEDKARNRIIEQEDGYSVVNTELKFTKEEISKRLDSNPENFSPNVILRPLYQETILPNLAYVGGPSELAYWLQLKSVFTHFNLLLPILIPRSFVMYLDNTICHKIKKLNLTLSNLFLRKDVLINKYIKSHISQDLDVEDERKILKKLYIALKQKALKVDKSLGASVESELVKGNKAISRIAYKMEKSEKRKHKDQLRMLDELYENLYPQGIPHERRENFLSINDPHFIRQLLNVLDPMELKYFIIKSE